MAVWGATLMTLGGVILVGGSHQELNCLLF